MDWTFLHILIPAINLLALVWVIGHLRATRFQPDKVDACVIPTANRCFLLSKDMDLLCPACMKKVRGALESRHDPTS